jgi:hypothetical protein
MAEADRIRIPGIAGITVLGAFETNKRVSEGFCDRITFTLPSPIEGEGAN